MKIVVAGGTGFLGQPLVSELLHRGHSVAVLTRDAARVEAGTPLVWDGRTQGSWSAEVAAADAVVNLSGESIGDGRWTTERKRRLLSSRLDPTRALVEALRSHPSRNRALINISAVGFYGVRGDEVLDESAPRGTGFLADLVERWEAAAREADDVARVVLPRLGVVLGPGGGALEQMAQPFRLGAGGPIANGRQWMSWVSRDDVIRFLAQAIETDSMRGVYNVTAPEPVRNRDFARALGRALHRPSLVPAPAFALRLMFGELADELLIGGQRVVPKRAQAEGFAFEAPSVEAALARAL